MKPYFLGEFDFSLDIADICHWISNDAEFNAHKFADWNEAFAL